LESKTYQIILFTESWLGHSIDDSQLVQNFPCNIVRADRSAKKGGGVCAFLAKTISFLRIDIPKNKNFDICAFDIIDSHIINKHRIILVYRAPSLLNHKYNFELIEQLSIPISVDHKFTIIGDINLPKLNWNTKLPYPNQTHIKKAYLEFTSQLHLTQMIDFPTRGNNLLDVILTESPHAIKNIKKLPSFSQNNSSSDHSSFEFSLYFTKDIHPNITKLDYKNANYENINYYLQTVDWNATFS